jgi:hypothetical protein
MGRLVGDDLQQRIGDIDDIEARVRDGMPPLIAFSLVTFEHFHEIYDVVRTRSWHLLVRSTSAHRSHKRLFKKQNHGNADRTEHCHAFTFAARRAFIVQMFSRPTSPNLGTPSRLLQYLVRVLQLARKTSPNLVTPSRCASSSHVDVIDGPTRMDGYSDGWAL